MCDRNKKPLVDHTLPIEGSFNPQVHPFNTHSFKWKVAFLDHKHKGSRAVGGKRPHNAPEYNSMESVSYLTPDTKREEFYFRHMSPDSRAFRAHFLFVLYGAIGIAVAVMVLVTLSLTGWIEKKRAYATKDFLEKDDLAMAWITWTGSSLALALVALLTVLYQPAAASSGIPGLIGASFVFPQRRPAPASRAGSLTPAFALSLSLSGQRSSTA